MKTKITIILFYLDLWIWNFVKWSTAVFFADFYYYSGKSHAESHIKIRLETEWTETELWHCINKTKSSATIVVRLKKNFYSTNAKCATQFHKDCCFYASLSKISRLIYISRHASIRYTRWSLWRIDTDFPLFAILLLWSMCTTQTKR